MIVITSSGVPTKRWLYAKPVVKEIPEEQNFEEELLEAMLAPVPEED